MVTIVKHEWHQVDSQFAYEIDEDILSEIYPDLSEEEIAKMLVDLEEGNIDVDTVVNDAWDNDIEIDWEHQYDDNWTSRKGGYDVTYELGDSDSWYTAPEDEPHTHKCTNCKWTGQKYDAEWSWKDKDGNEIEDPRKICPYCESDTELTEAGLEEEKKNAERRAKWDLDKANMNQEEVLEQALQDLKDEFEQLMFEEEKKNEG
jgi:hypothetical protein